MTKTTIKLNDDAWDLVLDILEEFTEIEIVELRNTIGKKVYPDDPEFNSKFKIRDVVREDYENMMFP